MSEHFTKARALELINIIRKHWKEHGKSPKLEVINDPISGFVVRSNMLNGKPTDDERPVYVPKRDVRLNKRVK